MVMCCIYLGLYDRGHLSINQEDMPGFWEPEPHRWWGRPLYKHLQSWLWETWVFLQIWQPDSHIYDVHTWTLPVEFRCSIILFITLVGIVRCGPKLRAVTLLGMVVYCHYSDFWHGWLFFAGSFLAQLKFIQDDCPELREVSLPTQADDLLTIPHDSPEEDLELSRADITRFVLFVTGLYLLSAPDSGAANFSPGYILLTAKLCPPTWLESWRALHSNSYLRWLFSNPVSRYLGNISYALYLVHGPIVHMLGFWLVPWMWDHVIGRDLELGRKGWYGMGMWGKELGFVYAFVIVTVVTVWCADLFWRGVDKKCVMLAKWVEARCTEKKM
jgi:peptidoglycan/LPS O-acetylase OafA/YrhL